VKVSAGETNSDTIVVRWITKEAFMADTEKITDGPNERAIDESIAGTGPGIPDDALAPGEELLVPPTDAEVARVARKLGAPVPEAEGKPPAPEAEGKPPAPKSAS
jgi:hypothetical protein